MEICSSNSIRNMDKDYIEKEMRKISAKKWYSDDSYSAWKMCLKKRG